MIHRLPLLWLCGVMALAAPKDPRGWTEGGTPAIDAPRMLKGMPEHPKIELPPALIKQMSGPTVLLYFSPTCPHCRHVAKELQRLASRLEQRQIGQLIGVASGSATEESVQEFRDSFGVSFPIMIDEDGAILSAMGARSTPSAMLVKPTSAKRVEVLDLWFPYINGFDSLVEGRAAGDLMSVFTEGRYHGSNFCGVCHGQEFQAWKLSHHGMAWRALERGEDTEKEECTRCHVTGAGEPTGWAGDPHSPLVDVGCESCHGPGGPHSGAKVAPSSQCATCHDPDHSIAFDVKKGLPLIDHYKGIHLSEEERRAIMMSLWDGSAPRALVAFDEGKNVGAGKCLSCHATEHEHWVNSPHAHAMVTLRPEGADDPACVRCHATPKVSGLPPSEVSEYNTLDGVGCESCHGPGEKHVAAGGGRGNIEGLGDDCPVCVIEAVCTQCHTPEHHAAWDLDRDLELVKHPAP